MDYQPPLDQRIVDEYFRLASSKKTKNIAWLYALVATYGLKPEELCNFNWGPDFSVTLPNRKKPVLPLHPQWTFLFNLKEKQPCNLQSCWPILCSSLYEAMAFQNVQLNITDLILAHKLRRNHYKQLKQQQKASLVFAGVS